LAGKQIIFLEQDEWMLLPIWREAFMGVEWFSLRTKPVYYGYGVPHGNGSAVITVPGFLGSDLYLTEMNRWLKRIGYRAYPSGVGRNAECPDILVDKLLDTIKQAYRETGERVHLIGHSLGGLLSRSAATMLPECVLSVTTLGSPFRGVRSHPSVMMTSRQVRQRILKRAHTRPAHKPLRQDCFTGACNCEFAESLRLGVPADLVHETALYTKTDGVVHWSVCVTGNPDTDIEVKGTHCGLTWNAQVYRTIAQRLALAEEAYVEDLGRACPPVMQATSVV